VGVWCLLLEGGVESAIFPGTTTSLNPALAPHGGECSAAECASLRIIPLGDGVTDAVRAVVDELTVQMAKQPTAMQAHSSRIAVLGAGLQGACIALELASRGARVDLYERNAICVAEASANNEGKIHLGFVYALDLSFETARLMVSGALRFEKLLRRWIGDDVEGLTASLPFAYAVHRQGLLTPEAFERHARRVSAWIAAESEGEDFSYFGSDLHRAPERLTDAELKAAYETDTTAAAFSTVEVSIDPEALARLVRRRLAVEPSISCLTNRNVVAVKEGERHMTVISAQNGSLDEEGYDYVVNTLWTGKLGIDAQLGLVPSHPWCFRFKYFIRAAAGVARNVPSLTIVLGRFGDIVNYSDGSIYLTWYPAGMTAWSKDLVPPQVPCILEGPEAGAIQQGIIEGLASVVPSVSELVLSDVEIKGGWILAWGETDIDDPRSGLHRRCAVGVHRQRRYLSVDTGKLTLAPLLAQQAVRVILE
jgi:hypothetical protein